MGELAPSSAHGRTQIIPDRGAHTQLYVPDDVAASLVYLGLVYYAADYGPDARVYRPCEGVSFAAIQRMIG